MRRALRTLSSELHLELIRIRTSPAYAQNIGYNLSNYFLKFTGIRKIAFKEMNLIAVVFPVFLSATTTTRQPYPYDSPSPPTSPRHFSFIHMTDVHVSETRPYSVSNLREFCNDSFPKLVADGGVLFLAMTGDLTDGIGPFWRVDSFGQQYGDWSLFKQAISGCIATGVPVFKIRGNHDCFGVESFHGESNAWFRDAQKLAVSKIVKDHPLLVIDSESGSYAFWDPIRSKSRFIFLENHRILPGPHQYYGEFSDHQSEWLGKFIEGSSNNQSESTYIFSHYPIGTLTPESQFRLLQAISKSSSHVTYLSGHIHSVVGKRGVQAIESHSRIINELQLSDYKWSGIVRKVDINTGVFVDIPTSDTSSAATILVDPSSPHKTLLTIYSADPLRFVAPCSNTSHHLQKLDDFNNMHVYTDIGPDISCFKVVPRGHSGYHISPIDTRLTPNSISWIVFEYWFEVFQLLILFLYLGVVYNARELYRVDESHISIYLVLSPLIPNLLSEHLYNHEWLIANTVAMFDLTTCEIIFETDSTRVVSMMCVYLISSSCLNHRKRNPHSIIANLLWAIILIPFVFMDARFTIGRGGLRALILSPHIWFMTWLLFKIIRRPAIPSKRSL